MSEAMSVGEGVLLAFGARASLPPGSVRSSIGRVQSAARHFHRNRKAAIQVGAQLPEATGFGGLGRGSYFFKGGWRSRSSGRFVPTPRAPTRFDRLRGSAIGYGKRFGARTRQSWGQSRLNLHTWRRFEDHHIVARKHARAAQARDVLVRYGIGVEDLANKVSLPYRYHRRLHTAKYFEAVDELLIPAQSRQEALEALEELSRLLAQGRWPWCDLRAWRRYSRSLVLMGSMSSHQLAANALRRCSTGHR